MELAKYKACICEGSAEAAIVDILVDNDLLIFTREEMLNEELSDAGTQRNLRNVTYVRNLQIRFLSYGF